jgi:CSLREA domain-containing protein
MNYWSLVSRIYMALLFTANLSGFGHTPIAVTLTTGHSYTVNTTPDTPDIDPTDGICADVHGKCSLRAAVMQANHTVGADTIILPAGTYQKVGCA